jgi:hypothetical protein
MRVQSGVNLGPNRGQPGVNLESTCGQRGVNLNPLTALFTSTLTSPNAVMVSLM